MAFTLTTTKEASRKQGLKVLVHGPAGAGKTVLCATTGDHERTLIISAEAGLLSVQDADIKVAEVSTLQDVKDIYSGLKAGCGEPGIINWQGFEFTWICLDSISEIAEVVLNNELKKSKDPRQAYGALYDEMLAIMRAFRDLPVNVYMSCKQEREVEKIDDQRERTKLVPSLPGRKLTQNISYMFDEVFALRVERDSNGPFRVLQTQPDGQYECKDRSGKLDVLEDPSLQSVYGKIMGSADDAESKAAKGAA